MTRKGKSKKKTIKVDVIPKLKFDPDIKQKEKELAYAKPYDLSGNVEKADKMFAESTLLKIRADIIEEANILFGGSTDATLMVRKIDEVFGRYL